VERAHQDGLPSESASVTLYLDDAHEPLAIFRPPAQARIDTTALADGEHVLKFHAIDEGGVMGVHTIPFVVRNGPYIAVSGIKPHEVVAGNVDLRVNAFSTGDHFDPIAAESRRPTPSIAWAGLSIFLAWAVWYGLGSFVSPPALADTSALRAANAPMGVDEGGQSAGTQTAASGAKIVGGFSYSATGPTLYAANCAGCHGAEGAGVPGAFPPLVKDAVVNATDAKGQIKIVLHGLSGKPIDGKPYASQMPAFSQLSDDDIAAIIDHERTSWNNAGPVITPAQVKQQR
jgi:mono/diheme cytochrome c family protein